MHRFLGISLALHATSVHQDFGEQNVMVNAPATVGPVIDTKAHACALLVLDRVDGQGQRALNVRSIILASIALNATWK